MITQIEFTISRTELIKTLRMLSPFIVIQKKEDDEYEEDAEIMLPEPYFYDKVTFLLYESIACLSVLTKEGVRVERTCHVESNVENVSFCIPHAYLLHEVAKGTHEAESFSFKEDRFFGFNVSDAITGKYLFDVDAYSVSKQPSIYPKHYDTLYPKTVSLEHETLLKVLKAFHNYTQKYPRIAFYESIWLYINNGVCRVVATNGSSLRQEIFQTKVMGSHTLSIPGKYAKRIYDIVVNWREYTCQQIGYNDTYLSLHNHDREGGFGESIEVPLNKCDFPDIGKVLAKHNIIYRSSLRLNDLKSSFRMINNMMYKDDYILMHFFPDHVNIHCKDTIKDQTISEFYDTLESDGEYVIRLNQKTLEKTLDEVYTDNVIFTLIDNNLMYINNDDEELFGDVIRIICTAEMRDEDQVFLERGDKSLLSHQAYIDKYLTKNEDNDEEMTQDSLATISEMKEVIDYTDIIDYFEETGLPQVYEPPYGASYSLEDDELENVRNVEQSRHVLVWGVIRCFMFYNRQEMTVDCMLHVSQNKDEWAREREDLRNRLPFVYTIMKEYPITDSGYISVYKSEGGTLLRR